MKKVALAFLVLGSLAAIPETMAGTVIGSATLIDNVVLHDGTVAPLSYLSYVSGGNGNTGTADGAWFTEGGTGGTTANALSSADHLWVQFDPAVLMYSQTALDSVIAIPAIDHGWNSQNTGEFWESFEFQIFGCTSESLSSCTEAGVISDVWKLGVDDSGPAKNADDWTTRWVFNAAYNYFGVFSGDRLVGGCFSCGEGELDALASGNLNTPPPVPLPGTFGLLGAGLAGIGLARRRAQHRS